MTETLRKRAKQCSLVRMVQVQFTRLLEKYRKLNHTRQRCVYTSSTYMFSLAILRRVEQAYYGGIYVKLIITTWMDYLLTYLKSNMNIKSELRIPKNAS